MQATLFAALLGLLTLAALVHQPAHRELLLPTSQTHCASSTNRFASGQQYVDSNHGVPRDAWSMLVRWQGKSIPGDTDWVTQPVKGDFSGLTGLQLPEPYSRYQRGYQPADPEQATPVVQMHCMQGAMLLNSWMAPHQPVRGGGWNTMYGFAWSAGERPHPFVRAGKSTELVIEGSLALPLARGFRRDRNGNWTRIRDLNRATQDVSVQYNLFAYLRDTRHPRLPAIAVLGGVYGNGMAAGGQCRYHLGFDYPQGVWFSGSQIQDSSVCRKSNAEIVGPRAPDGLPYATVRYTQGRYTNQPFARRRLYRFHVTGDDLRNIVDHINAFPCQTDCPGKGYSSNPADYVLDYFGVILETIVCHGVQGSRVCSTGFDDRQVVTAANARNLRAWAWQRGSWF